MQVILFSLQAAAVAASFLGNSNYEGGNGRPGSPTLFECKRSPGPDYYAPTCCSSYKPSHRHGIEEGENCHPARELGENDKGQRVYLCSKGTQSPKVGCCEINPSPERTCDNQLVIKIDDENNRDNEYENEDDFEIMENEFNPGHDEVFECEQIERNHNHWLYPVCCGRIERQDEHRPNQQPHQQLQIGEQCRLAEEISRSSDGHKHRVESRCPSDWKHRVGGCCRRDPVRDEIVCDKKALKKQNNNNGNDHHRNGGNGHENNNNEIDFEVQISL